MSTKRSGKAAPASGDRPGSGADTEPEPVGGRLARLGAAVLCLLGLIAFGFMAGGFLGGRVFGGGEVGWDALANALGGAVIGALSGIVVFIVLLGRSSTRLLLSTGAAGVIAAALLLGILEILEP